MFVCVLTGLLSASICHRKPSRSYRTNWRRPPCLTHHHWINVSCPSGWQGLVFSQQSLLFVCLLVEEKKARGDEKRADDGGRESGSIMSVGRLTSDILERPVSEERQSVCQRWQMLLSHTCTETQIEPQSNISHKLIHGRSKIFKMAHLIDLYVLLWYFFQFIDSTLVCQMSKKVSWLLQIACFDRNPKDSTYNDKKCEKVCSLECWLLKK